MHWRQLNFQQLVGYQRKFNIELTSMSYFGLFYRLVETCSQIEYFSIQKNMVLVIYLLDPGNKLFQITIHFRNNFSKATRMFPLTAFKMETCCVLSEYHRENS